MIYIGTSGYSYKDWIDPFYPQGTKSGDMIICTTKTSFQSGRIK